LPASQGFFWEEKKDRRAANNEHTRARNMSKATTGKERVVAACAEPQSTSRGPSRTRFLAVQAAIRAKMQCDKKSLLAETDASKKRNLILVGGHADNAICVEKAMLIQSANASARDRQC
jgi:hypothetical protein